MKNIWYFLIIMFFGILFTAFGLLRLHYISGIKKKGLIITGIITLIIWTFIWPFLWIWLYMQRLF